MSSALRRNALLLIHGAIPMVMALVMLGPLNYPPALCAHDAGSAHLAPTVAPPPVELAMGTWPTATDVDPLAPVTVTATAGDLVSVTMVNDAGKPIEGVSTPDNTVWKPTVPLGYGRTYTVTATAIGADKTTRALVSTAPCPPRWEWAVAKPSAGAPSASGPSRASTR